MAVALHNKGGKKKKKKTGDERKQTPHRLKKERASDRRNICLDNTSRCKCLRNHGTTTATAQEIDSSTHHNVADQTGIKLHRK